ncbi:hypothetical protein [Flavobacterium sp.]
MTLYNKSFESFQKNYIGFAALIVIDQSCLGSAAAMYVLENGIGLTQMVQLGLVVTTCMLVNVSILSQLKPKFVFNFTIFSVLLSVLLIAFNAL